MIHHFRRINVIKWKIIKKQNIFSKNRLDADLFPSLRSWLGSGYKYGASPKKLRCQSWNLLHHVHIYIHIYIYIYAHIYIYTYIYTHVICMLWASGIIQCQTSPTTHVSLNLWTHTHLNEFAWTLVASKKPRHSNTIFSNHILGYLLIYLANITHFVFSWPYMISKINKKYAYIYIFIFIFIYVKLSYDTYHTYICIYSSIYNIHW